MDQGLNFKMKFQKIFCIVSGVFSVVLGYLEYLGILQAGNNIMLGAAILFGGIFFILLFFSNQKKESKQLKFINSVASMFIVLISSWGLLSAIFYFSQCEIFSKNNVIFQPRLLSHEDASYIANEDDSIENISITTADNVTINGWLVKNSTDDKLPLLIYFAGSGQEVSRMIRYAKKLEGWFVALINYRGYGISEGVPSQDAVFNDATLIYDTLAQRVDIDNKKIVSMGWSLGTAVAVHLSANRPISGTILVSPIDSMSNRLQRDLPLMPISILMKQPFDSLSQASSIETPLLTLIGDADKHVSPDSSLRLVDKWKGKKTVKRYELEDHFLLHHVSRNNSWKDIKEYLATL